MKPTNGYEKLPLRIIIRLRWLFLKEMLMMEEDCAYGDVDGRKRANVRGAIGHWLSLADPSKDNQEAIMDALHHSEFEHGAPIGQAMRIMGYEMICDEKEQEAILAERRKRR